MSQEESGWPQFEARKRDHIRQALDAAHQADGMSGLDRIHLLHEALPELDLSEVRLDSTCLGRATRTPFYVAGMTAGHPDASKINRTLAQACQKRGWAMGIGSQRRELEAEQPGQPELLREEAPELVLFGNIGLSQLITADFAKLKQLVRRIGAQGLAVHLNALQEAIQPEGTPVFRGGLAAIERACRELDVPVIVKETGCGIGPTALQRLAETGVAAVDVSGLGGTHWGRIEGARAAAGSIHARAAATFATWGESTADCVAAAAQLLPAAKEIWASGGVRSGLDAAKLIALGAHRVGYAKPALEAALAGPEALDAWMEAQEYELKVALFCTGCATPEALRRKEGAWIANVG